MMGGFALPSIRGTGLAEPTGSGLRLSPLHSASSPGCRVLALIGDTRRWEPKKLRLWLFPASPSS